MHDSPETGRPAGFEETDAPMIEALNSDDLIRKFGGRFKLTALIQRRLGELIAGDRPLVERRGRSDLEVVVDEILQDKISLTAAEES
jgi:DNA-directed RNA polymerase subunit omega